MPDLRRDPLVNIIDEGIKGDLRTVLEQGRHRAAVVLTFAGIDAMAYLGMPADQQEVRARDFMAWCDRHIRFPGLEQLTGQDLYGARCGIMHSYSAASRMSRDGQCRHVVYAFKRPGPPVVYRPEVNKTMVIVAIEALADAFLRGVDRSLVDIFSNPVRAAVAEQRFGGMYHLVPACSQHKRAVGASHPP